MSDNVATLKGYTREISGSSENASDDLLLLVKPATDLDSCFLAWDMDVQEFVRVNGWMYHFEDN